MKGLLYNKSAKDKLIYCDIKKPIPNNNELLVRINAVSVNAADYRLYKMGHAPKKKIFGADISGVVESVGMNVHTFKVGDEVIGDISDFGFGGFAEYTTAPEKAFVLKPAKLSFEEASALPIAGITALQALRDKGNIQSGQKILIVGSSGGVGTFAIQLAKYFGSIVIGVCSSKNVEQTKLLGADKVIDYSKENFSIEIGTYDLILAINGNYALSAYKRCLNQNGKCVFVGGALSQVFKTLFFGKLMFLGSKKMCNLFAKSNQKDMEYITKLAKDSKIRAVVEKVYSLENSAEAMRYVANGHASGKVVIKVI